MPKGGCVEMQIVDILLHQCHEHVGISLNGMIHMISASDCDFVEAHARGSYGDWLATWHLWLLACIIISVMVMMRVLSPCTRHQQP